MIGKINELCYAYEAYGRASALKDREAQAEASREMARLRAELKRAMRTEKQETPKKPAIGPFASVCKNCDAFDGGICRRWKDKPRRTEPGMTCPRFNRPIIDGEDE